jgi:hypothetical protein
MPSVVPGLSRTFVDPFAERISTGVGQDVGIARGRLVRLDQLD